MSEKGRKIYNGITNIDDDLIMAALAAKPQAVAPVKKKKSAMYYVYRWGAAAAAVIALAVVGILVIPVLTSKNTESATANYASPADTSSKEEHYSETADATDDAGGSYYPSAGQDEEASSSTNSEDADSFEFDSEDSVSDGETGAITEIGEDQILVDFDIDDIEEVTVIYPGYDDLIVESSVAAQIVELVNELGILNLVDDYDNETDEKCATIELLMNDGSIIEISPQPPYIIIDGEAYESMNQVVDEIITYLNDLVLFILSGGE